MAVSGGDREQGSGAASAGAPVFVVGTPCAFSSSCSSSSQRPEQQRCRLLALSGPDGRLRVWETEGSRLRHEYVPSAHLSAACTCLAWAPPSGGGGRPSPSKEGPQRKKRKSEVVEAGEQLDLLAIGTADGSILLYSTIKGELQSKLSGHDNKINCVRWHQDNGCLYSCSDDKNIVEWNIRTCKVKCKWKGDNSSVTSLCISPDGKMLLSAGRSIKLWDLETKEAYRYFTGHATAVSALMFITVRPPNENQPFDGITGLYFLSGAVHDRLLSVWQVRSDRKEKNAVMNFTVTDEPIHIDMTISESKEEPVKLAVVCRDGQLHVFEQVLNGYCKKPLTSKSTIQIATPGDSSDSTPKPVPILAAAFCADKESLLLVYGNSLQPVLERVSLNATEPHMCLVRDIQKTLTLKTEMAITKAFGRHIKPPTRIKPDPKGCFEAAGEHIKPPTQTKPESKGCFKAIREHIKRPTWMKPDPKGFVRAAAKPFLCMLSCIKRQKDKDDCPGLPEGKVSYVDEDIPESLASRSCISLTDSESDGCPAEADLGPRSDSLEGIPEMLEAESLPSLLENNEDKEAAGKDGEKDLDSHDPCPAEAEPNPVPASTLDSLPQPQVTNAEEASPETLPGKSLSSSTDSEAGSTEADPGPRSDRVLEPQGRPSDEKPSDQAFDEDAFNSSRSDDLLHQMCSKFTKLPKEQKCNVADFFAQKHLDSILEHFLETEETACDQLMCAVLRSTKCNLDMCMNEFIIRVNEYHLEYSKEVPLAKVKALRGIKAIVADLDNVKGLKFWLQHHFVTQANFLVSQFQPKEEGSSRTLKTYLVPGEAIDILAILLQRLNLVQNMKHTLYYD